MTQRAIKFRVFDKETGQMRLVTQLYMPKDDRIQMNTSKGWLDDGAPLMQFTGFTDKNGKEIYEGDIVRTAETLDLSVPYLTFEVIWMPARYTHVDPAFRLRDPKNKSNYGFEQIVKGRKYLEVIGSIYENPELLPDERSNQN